MRSKQYFTSIKNNPHEISTDPFYLLTAYHLNKEYGLKALEKKMKKRLQTPL